MEFYLALFFANFFEKQKNRIDKLFQKMDTFLFFEEKIEIELHPFKNQYSLFSKFDNFVLSSRFFFTLFFGRIFSKGKKKHVKKIWMEKKAAKKKI